ncbi:MAG TPA: hypothetical protein VGE05_09350 [Novosphingobium sp.]
MKISETTSYPHPVLAPWSSDVAGSTFTAELTLREDGAAQQIDIHSHVQLDQADLVTLIENGDAAFGCFITCVSTGFRRMQRFGYPSGSHQFAPGALLGRVQLRPMIWAVRPIKSWRPTGAHSEFGGGADIEPGQILALDDEQRVDVLRPPLPSIESIFEIFSSTEVAEGEFDIDMAGDRINILMGEATYSLVQGLRQTTESTRSVVMNALFVPVVMEVLSQIMTGEEQFSSCRWFEPFRKRSELLDVDLKAPSLLTDAQLLLGKPFNGLSRLFDEEETDDE